MEDAAVAAVLEAIQSRLTLISGGRDDLLAAEYATNAAPQLGNMFADVDFTPVETRIHQTSAGTLQLPYLIDRLFERGIRGIYAFALGSHECGVHVARVLADDLVSAEGPIGAPRKDRAARKLLERWLEP
jgi:ribosomal protein S12 methylthiotransferase accessory factor